jgi:hypothetical protein
MAAPVFACHVRVVYCSGLAVYPSLHYRSYTYVPHP